MCALFAVWFATIVAWCTSSTTPEQLSVMKEEASNQIVDASKTEKVDNSQTTSVQTNFSSAIYSSSELFTDRDLDQTPDLDDAIYYTVSDWYDINITEEWVYVLQWTASDVTVYVEVDKEEKVQIVLDWVTITNTDFPCIYIKQADKVFITTTDSENTLEVTEAFVDDWETNTNGVIFSKDDITLNWVWILNINSTKNWIVWKDDLKITWWTYNIIASKKAIDANDSIRIIDWTFVLNVWTDWLHAENNDDDSLWYIYIWGGEFTINAWDDAIHWTSIVQIDDWDITITGSEWIEWTIIQINWWNINITASDDWINAASKSKSYEVAIVFNGWYTKIVMWGWDTDWIDSNGNLYIYWWTIDITARSPSDYDWKVVYEWWTLIIDWEEYNYVPNQQIWWGGMWWWRWSRWWNMDWDWWDFPMNWNEHPQWNWWRNNRNYQQY